MAFAKRIEWAATMLYKRGLSGAWWEPDEVRSSSSSSLLCRLSLSTRMVSAQAFAQVCGLFFCRHATISISAVGGGGKPG